MKFFSLILTTVASFITVQNEQFNDWVKTFSIDLKDTVTQSRIFNNWVANDELIRDTNVKELSYTLAHIIKQV